MDGKYIALMRSIAGGGEPGRDDVAGADYAQNDPNGIGYIANRPLW